MATPLQNLIDAYIRRNANQEITGPVLNGVLSAIADALETPFIGADGYWYIYDPDQGEFVRSNTQAQGPQGPQGPAGPTGPAGVTSASATIDANVGTPSVNVALNAGALSFAFHNLKGQTGAQGPQGPQGPPGSDAQVTAANITAALGYTPIGIADVPQEVFWVEPGFTSYSDILAAITALQSILLIDVNDSVWEFTGFDDSEQEFYFYRGVQGGMQFGILAYDGTWTTQTHTIPATYAGSASAGGPANKALAIPFGAVDAGSTSTAMTATVDNFPSTLAAGVCAFVTNGVVTSASGFTLDINGTGALPVYQTMAAATRVTTAFDTKYTWLFVYNPDRVAGGCWDAYYGYYTSTNSIGYQVRTNSCTLPLSDACYRYRILFQSPDGTKLVPSNKSTSTSETASKAVNQTPIDPFGLIVYYSYTTAKSAGQTLGVTYLWQQYVASIGYSFNPAGGTPALTTNMPVYVKAAPQSDGSAIIDDTTPYVQALPTTQDGKIYIFLGIATSATSVEVNINHAVYYYKNGAIREWTNAEAVPDISGLEEKSNKVTSLSAASTDTEYPSAKCVWDLVNSIGGGDFRLIASGTTTADVQQIIVTDDMDGNPLSLSDVIVYAKTRRVSSGYTGWVKLEFTCTTGTQVSGAIFQQTAKDPNNDYYVTSLHHFKRIGNYLMPLTLFRSANDTSVKNSLVIFNNIYAVESLTTVSGSINKVRIYGYAAGAIGEGTEYEIYGIDA